MPAPLSPDPSTAIPSTATPSTATPRVISGVAPPGAVLGSPRRTPSGSPSGPPSAVISPRPVAEPRARIFLLHHAAGSHRVFADWVGHFPQDWEVCLLEAPGRRRLSHLPASRSAATLAGFFHERIRTRLDRPYALFGHSMGAAVAFELAAQLHRAGAALPHWLGVSACRAPAHAADALHLPHGAPPRPLHALPDPELRTALARMGGLPDRALADEEVWRRLAPRIRDDFRLAEEWRPSAARAPHPVALSLFGGAQDPVVTHRQLLAWEEAAARPVGRHLYRGGHFYFRSHTRAVVGRIVSEARRSGLA